MILPVGTRVISKRHGTGVIGDHIVINDEACYHVNHPHIYTWSLYSEGELTPDPRFINLDPHWTSNDLHA